MYMLVFVPHPDPEGKAAGRWKKGRQVTTDLKGNELSAEVAAERERRKAFQRAQNAARDQQSRNSSLHNLHGGLLFPPMPPARDECCHKEAVAREHRSQPAFQPGVADGILASPGTRWAPPAVVTHGCNCGAACACAFCPEHPKNNTSLRAVAQQANFITSQQRALNAPFTNFNFPDVQDASCMGGMPQFAMSTRPMAYNMQAVEAAFPAQDNQGFVMSYGMRRARSTTPRPPLSSQYPPMVANPELTQSSPATGLDQANFDWDFANMDNFELGDFNMVTNNGPNGWQEHTQTQGDLLDVPQATFQNQFGSDATLPEMSVTPPIASSSMPAMSQPAAEVDIMTLDPQILQNAMNGAFLEPATPMSMATSPFAPSTPLAFGTNFAPEEQGYFTPGQLHEASNTHFNLYDGQ